MDKYTVSEQEIKEKGVQAVPGEVLYGDPLENKKIFDRLTTYLIEKYNKAMEVLFRDSHVHENKTDLDSITDMRMIAWDHAAGILGGELLAVKVVSKLPEQDISEQTLYLVPAEGELKEGQVDLDKCLAFVRKGDRWKQLISKTDLTDYYKKTEVDLKLSSDETAEKLFGKPLSFTEAKTDVDIASGDSLKVLFGKLLKTIKTFRTKHTTMENTLQSLSGTTPISRGGTGETVRYEAVTLARKTANTPVDSTATCRYYPYLKMCFARIYIAPRNTLTYKTGEAYVLYTIPEEYRPSTIHAGSCHVGGSANGTVRVNSAGEIALIPDKDVSTGWGVYITAFWLL